MSPSDPPKGCAACETEGEPRLLEEHHDPIGGKDYRILSCPACGVVFSEPREAVGGDWYAAAAPLRLEEFGRAPETDWRFAAFLDEGLEPGRLLDVGCGDGGFLRLARAKGWKVAGFDYDERVVEAARADGLDDVSSQEFFSFVRSREAKEFDAVTLFDVLEHAPEPLRFLRELRRLIRPGGVLAVTFPNALRPLPWGREQHDYPPHHFTRWTPAALRGFLERNGFSLIRLEDSRLRVYYLAEHLFFYGIMRRLLPMVKGVLFGKDAGARTLSELYDKSREDGEAGPCRAFRDKRVRHRWVSALKSLLKVFTYPVAAGMTLYFRLTRRHCGEHLYVLARLNPGMEKV